MGLSDKDAAFKPVEEVMAVIPIEKDAVQGPIPIEDPGPDVGPRGEPGRTIADERESSIALATPGQPA